MKNIRLILPYFLGILFTTASFAQTHKPLPKDWHLQDLQKTGYFGISLDKAYDLVKSKKTKTVIVAVIDSGIDTNQTDLNTKLWTNTKEIPGNGKDDDKNGYVDDIHGWNFLGGPNGKSVIKETSEEIRMYATMQLKFKNADSATLQSKEFKQWEKLKLLRDKTIEKTKQELDFLTPFSNALHYTSILLSDELKIDTLKGFSLKDLEKVKTDNDTLTQAKALWSNLFEKKPDDTSLSIFKELEGYINKLNQDLNPDLEARKNIIGDNPNDNSNPFYGNNLIKQSDSQHGTAVAGLIAANRNNAYGIKGILNDVKIMAIKAVPDGDEYDKDVANAIKYAVNNGAKIINLSFGKKISPQKEWVDDAFKYAAKKNVLIVQAAGNEGESLEEVIKYPNDTFIDGSGIDAANVICVGASTAYDTEKLPANFSNYSQTGVDVFAPGEDVTSITLDEEFLTASGTSFSSPITTGVAALLLSYYPKLSAIDLKQIILTSSVKPKDLMVITPGKSEKKVNFSTLSKTGGVVNAYEALKMAARYK